jgi:hypothetical protein
MKSAGTSRPTGSARSAVAPVPPWTAAVRASRISRIMSWITAVPPWSKPPYGKRKRNHGWIRIGVRIRVRWWWGRWRIIRIRIAYRLLG